MSFQNTVGPDGYNLFNFRSININVVPSFGRIVNVIDIEKDSKVIC